MNLEASERNGAHVLKVAEDRIDAASAVQFKDTVRELVGDGTGRVILDLSQVQFLDSSGLGAVVATMKFLGADRRLELAALTPTVEKVLKLTRMDSVFVIHPSVDTALGPVSKAS